MLPGKKGHLTVRAEQGKNGTAAVLFRGEKVHHNGVELEAEWVTLSISPCLCPSGILVALSTESKKKNSAKMMFQATRVYTGELICWYH